MLVAAATLGPTFNFVKMSFLLCWLISPRNITQLPVAIESLSRAVVTKIDNGPETSANAYKQAQIKRPRENNEKSRELISI